MEKSAWKASIGSLVKHDACELHAAIGIDQSQFTTFGCLLRKNKKHKRERDREDET